jgi:hypothetical protein
MRHSLLWSLSVFLLGCAASSSTGASAPTTPAPGAPTAAAGATHTMRAPGIEVTVDAPGWTLDLASAPIKDRYYRLGQFSNRNGEVISILVDDAPPVGLDGLLQHTVQSYSERGQVTVLERERVGGQPACEITFVSTPVPQVPNMQRREIYVEALMAGRWIELHYSAPEEANALARARAALEPLFGTLRARPTEAVAAAAPPPAPLTEIGEAELASVGQLLHCSEEAGSFYCRALVAFGKGTRPSWSPQPTGLAGASVVLPGPGSPYYGKVAIETSYLVVGTDAALCGSLRPDNEEEKQQAEALLRAVLEEKPLPDNGAVQEAHRLTKTRPAKMTERSLSWQHDNIGFARVTPMGLVVLERVEGSSWIVGVYPQPNGPQPNRR